MERIENENWKTYAKRKNYFKDSKLMNKTEILEYEKAKRIKNIILEDKKKIKQRLIIENRKSIIEENKKKIIVLEEENKKLENFDNEMRRINLELEGYYEKAKNIKNKEGENLYNKADKIYYTKKIILNNYINFQEYNNFLENYKQFKIEFENKIIQLEEEKKQDRIKELRKQIEENNKELLDLIK